MACNDTCAHECQVFRIRSIRRRSRLAATPPEVLKEIVAALK
jgi:hypothetical protein